MTTEKRPLTPEALADFTRAEDAQISPDGALVAYVAGDYFTVDSASPASRIWLAPSDGSAPASQLTRGPRADTTPRWSPDGTQLAFLSDRDADGLPQLYLIDRAGGQARRLTDLAGRIEELEWSPDGARLAFLMTDPDPAAGLPRGRGADDAYTIEQPQRWRRLWVLDLASGTAAPATGEQQIWEFSWAPDGGFVLLIGSEPYEWSWFTAKLARLGPAGGAPELIYSAPEKQFAFPRVSPDGKLVAFLSCILSDRGSNGGDVLVMPLEGGPVRNLTADYPGSVWAMQWASDSATLDFLAFEQGEAALGRVGLDGEPTTRWRAPVGLHEHFGGQFRARGADLVAAVRASANSPQEIWVAAPDAAGAPAWRQVSSLNAHVAHYTLGETRELRWSAADGLELRGQLVLPVGYQAGQRVPLITWVHGGPAWLWMHGFYGAGRQPAQLFANNGYAVLLANPRGSTGWGVGFTEANIGDFGGRDYQDIIAGVDHVIELGIADPARLGIAGWSYGGYISAWAITQTDRFKAASVGAGIANWRSFHGVAEIGTWDQISLRADPYEIGGIYDQRAPLTHIRRARTPTLIVHGEADTIVPVGQSYELFRALKDQGVPTELVIYPREPHGFRERAHNIDRMRRYLAWFARYL